MSKTILCKSAAFLLAAFITSTTFAELTTNPSDAFATDPVVAGESIRA